MSQTPNFKLPLISGNMTADVPRDMNALAEAIDTNVKEALSDVTVPEATLTKKGVVKLSNAIDSESETEAATPRAVHNLTKYADANIDISIVEAEREVGKSVRGLEREVANLNLQLEASKRVPSGLTFGSNFADSFGMNIDMTKTETTIALSVGETSIPVKSVTGLAAGMEVTIYDGVNLERVKITSISGNALTVPPLGKSFKEKANVARTSAMIDMINKCAKFGGWISKITNTANDTEVAAGSRTTKGNGGRKLARLENGWLVACAINTSNGPFDVPYIYLSKDNGMTWELSKLQINVSSGKNIDVSITSKGNLAFIAVAQNGSGPYGYLDVHTFDFGMGKSFGNPRPSSPAPDEIANCSTVINGAGTEIHAAWSCKTREYSNSFNIQYAKGIINADGSITWGASQQVTTSNGIGINSDYPSIVLTANGVPWIICSQKNTTTARYYILVSKLGTSGWGTPTVVSESSYSQERPSAVYIPSHINGLKNGRIFISWESRDSKDDIALNITIAYNDDDGSGWKIQKITSGNMNHRSSSSITVDKNNNVYVAYCASLGMYNSTISMKKYSDGVWGNEVTISTGTERNYPSTIFDLTLDVSSPLFIFTDVTNARIRFCGTWVVQKEIQLQENDIRFKVKDTDEAVTWVQRDNKLTLTATLNGHEMDKTTVDNEDQFLKALDTSGPAEIRLTMKRDSTSDNVKITKILGGAS